MSEQQKRFIIDAYNAAVRDMRYYEERIDESPIADSKHSYALGTQNGIDRVLELLGYTLIVDDEDFAVEIEKE